jgi:hypothetical protein
VLALEGFQNLVVVMSFETTRTLFNLAFPLYVAITAPSCLSLAPSDEVPFKSASSVPRPSPSAKPSTPWSERGAGPLVHYSQYRAHAAGRVGISYLDNGCGMRLYLHRLFPVGAQTGAGSFEDISHSAKRGCHKACGQLVGGPPKKMNSKLSQSLSHWCWKR